MNSDQPHNEHEGDARKNDPSSPPEYRLVPVEAWEQVQKHGLEEHKVDVWALAGTVWDRKRIILKVTGIFVLIGLAIALLSPVEYKVDATLLPEAQPSMGITGGLLEQYGGLIGLGGGLSLGKDGNIPPELYPEIVHSLPFQLELLNRPVHFANPDTTVSTYTFFNEIDSPSIFGYIKGYTLGLPAKISGLFAPETPPKPLPTAAGPDSIVTVTKHQMRIINEMRGRLEVAIDEETSLINLSVSMPDPKAAAQIGQLSIKLLEKYITDYRTQKATEDLAFIREQMQKARKEFREIQQQLAEFEDSNIGILTAQALTQKQQLQSAYELRFNTYSSLAQKVEQAKLKVQAKTPVVTVLGPIKMPVDNYKPRRRLIVIIFFLAGLLASVGYVVGKEVLRPQN